MANRWHEYLHLYGWKVVLEECKWGTTDDDGMPGQVIADGVAVTGVPHRVGFKALGVMVAFDGHSVYECIRRFGLARAAFGEHKAALCNHRAPIKKRLLLLESNVEKTLLACWDEAPSERNRR